ncbi:MAG: hypothetical protein NE327_20795 [Lentisphaeraceae bacterium]|nr:hypothetical protein [Lentisphaeraceae bacterium]
MNKPGVQESEQFAYSTAVDSQNVAELIAALGVSGDDDNTSEQLTKEMVSLVGKVQDIYNLPKLTNPDQVDSTKAIEKIFEDNSKVMQEIYSGKKVEPSASNLLNRFFYSS